MEIVQFFYNQMAEHYDLLFRDWDAATKEQALILHRLFSDAGFDMTAQILDCACGIGTQTVGLAALGYQMTASDLSEAELVQAKERTAKRGLTVRFERADFCALSEVFAESFDIVIAMDNAIPHMLTKADLERAVKSIIGQVKENGIFVASIRDYDTLLKEKPPYSPPYIHQTASGQRVSFQTWTWTDENYHLVQYMIEDEATLRTSKFECEYRAVRRAELTELLYAAGCCSVQWKMPEETGFYQPVVIAKK